MPEPNHYQAIGVSEDADAATIKAAVKRLQRRYHPDTNKSATAHDAIVAANIAWEVLGKPERRARYDAELRAEREAVKRAEHDRARAEWEANERAKAAGFKNPEDHARAERAAAAQHAKAAAEAAARAKAAADAARAKAAADAAQQAKRKPPPKSNAQPPPSPPPPSPKSNAKGSRPSAWRLGPYPAAIGLILIGLLLLRVGSMSPAPRPAPKPAASAAPTAVAVAAPVRPRSAIRRKPRRKRTDREETAAANRAMAAALQNSAPAAAIEADPGRAGREWTDRVLGVDARTTPPPSTYR